MALHNMMESVVRNCLKDLLQSRKLLECSEKEQDDIMAIALNQLPAKYVSTSQGEVFAKTQLKIQVQTDVYRELSFAIDKVLRFSRTSILEARSEE